MTPLTYSRFTLRRCLVITANVLLVCGFLGYIIFQARFLLQGPLVTFQDGVQQVHSAPVVTLEGQAENIVSLTLNGREIYTDRGGNFSEPLVLENGYTIATITARDRYGRERAYEKRFVYTGSNDET